jgi:hypothetical protein
MDPFGQTLAWNMAPLTLALIYWALFLYIAAPVLDRMNRP